VKDYYKILGVDRSATDDDIKRAFRRLASQHHPDKGGDTEQFQEIQEAYSVLGDPQRRTEYDAPPQVRIHRGGPPGFDFDAIFDMFGARFGDPRTRATVARIQLWISLIDVAQGGPRTISVSSPAGQHNIEITIPPGLQDGESVRYPRLAPGGVDLVVMFRVKPETGWERHDQDVICDVTVSVWDLVLGKDINLTTLSGREITVSIPSRTQPNSMLRIRGHGLPHRNGSGQGDLMVRLMARIPREISSDLLEHIRRERGH
jgi:curved DNA-binding protein